ncbi:unnamed protein product [Prorocentrum cordatum]|uniref:Uncharacterized protein n=1 Tax=Prorocentrum cordatum TaxID=2364126 RepID=A0ABN9UPA8_9DINO|nr:unnamed protein product [Polarella glacialis]
MTYPQLSPRVGTTSQVPDELLIELNSKLAEECEEHQALTKKMMDDNRMAVQSQLDDMRRTFQDMFDDHRKSTELVIEEHRRTSEQRLREVSQTCQQLDIQLGRTMAEERAAVQGALQAVAQVLQRERAESRVDMQHAMAALRNGLPSEEPPCSSKTADGEALAVTPGQLDAALEALRRELQQQLWAS